MAAFAGAAGRGHRCHGGGVERRGEGRRGEGRRRDPRAAAEDGTPKFKGRTVDIVVGLGGGAVHSLPHPLPQHRLLLLQAPSRSRHHVIVEAVVGTALHVGREVAGLVVLI